MTRHDPAKGGAGSSVGTLGQATPEGYREEARSAQRTLAAVRRFVFAATAEVLLDLIPEHEFYPVPPMPERWCPSCQRRRHGAVAHGPAVTVSADGLTWECCRCRRAGTLAQLQSMTLGSAPAFRRVVDLLEEGDQ